MYSEEAGRAPLRSGTVPRTKEDLEIDELEDAFGGISEVSYTLKRRGFLRHLPARRLYAADLTAPPTAHRQATTAEM